MWRAIMYWYNRIFKKGTNCQAWFWAKEWQNGEKEVDNHIKNNEFEEYGSISAFLNNLGE